MVPQHGERPSFTAGQVAVLEVGDFRPTYIAFASAPDEDEFEFLIKRGQSANTASALFDPPVDKLVALKDIVGRGFPLSDHKEQDLIFIAMGTALAPLRSALRHIFRSRHEYGRLVVLYGVRTTEDFCFAQEMATEWRNHEVDLRRVISRPGDCQWDGPTGYVQGLLDSLIPTLHRPVALVCRSKEMIEQTRECLLNMNFVPEKILTNY
jgi:sulfhydrogenase subunit gamma (sulfur reductase)